MRDASESRPGGETEAAKSIAGGVATEAILERRADVLLDLDALAAHVAGSFVVVVERCSGKYHRRCYLSAKSAENAARSALERGETATVYLAELTPLWRVASTDAALDGLRSVGGGR